jgi:hypothetical protein
MNFPRKYNELKMKSYDIALRISDLESSLGYDNLRITKLKRLFSKLQSAVNFAIYYRHQRMEKESALHMDYADKIAGYIYSACETMEIPKSEVEIRLDKPKKRGFRLTLSRTILIMFVVFGLVYSAVLYWFFIR